MTDCDHDTTTDFPQMNRYKWNTVKRTGNSSKAIILDIVRDGQSVLSFDAEQDGIIYTIANPQYYRLPSSYDVTGLKANWFDKIEIGDVLSLKIFRPLSEDELEDSVIVMDNEAYGYWFATPIEWTTF